MNERNASDIEKAMVMDVLNLIEEIIKKKPELVQVKNEENRPTKNIGDDR